MKGSRGRDPDDATDEELMSDVRDGDLEQLGVLFDRHHKRLFHFCLRMTGSRAVAEDLTQEVFTRMLKYRNSFRSDSRYLAWMYRIARNCCHDHLLGAAPLEELERAGQVVDESVGDAQRRVEHDENLSLLRRAFLRLPLERREVLVLSRFEERRYAEIAEMLETTVGAVKVRVHRAIGELRRVYCELLEETAA